MPKEAKSKFIEDVYSPVTGNKIGSFILQDGYVLFQQNKEDHFCLTETTVRYLADRMRYLRLKWSGK